MNPNLIIDVGMHTGRDTEHYLSKGFDVVAIEADERHVNAVSARLAEHVESGRLKILNVAINDYDGEADFYANAEHDDWGTLSPEFVERNEQRYDSAHERRVVKCTRFENVLAEHGVPFYLKIDIEGLDLLCIRALEKFETRPTYVSYESDQKDFEGAFTELSELWQLGYRSFKIVFQKGDTSGPFGEDTPGPWMTIEETLDAYRRLLRAQKWFGDQGGWDGRLRGTFAHRLYRRYRRVTGRPPLSWVDVHARHPN